LTGTGTVTTAFALGIRTFLGRWAAPDAFGGSSESQRGATAVDEVQQTHNASR
jgi:hypothetical protein